ncbi:MAG: hypothetical protein RDU76_00720 [Candidatus Edwardsbacteria bacterium]|nr:hypothetical protein [Candidatus Edwardsbacteria bacterium]
MKIIKKEYIYKESRDDLLAQLRGKVFHVTTHHTFYSMQASGFIGHNKEERFPLNTTSENSLGRKRGWVCFFDLRNISDEDLEWTLRKYYFLEPDWFTRYTKEDTISELAYLILDDSALSKIISIEDVKKNEGQTQIYEHYVPEAEVWYPSDVPFSLVKEVLLVIIQRKAPKDKPWLYAHHMDAYEKQQNKSGS